MGREGPGRNVEYIGGRRGAGRKEEKQEGEDKEQEGEVRAASIQSAWME